ncbi:uncharacterized protein LOC109853548 [Pseudomyrmex gracilis]|uniref:uncharacterized protein LOC109853548 n=1 Tax=Pseudomyrmex gracilis TaxID=219809 RepID=UPI0009958958|nr:uncharacterized protein LOC109853548 [Pseudomyrmex gracilis]
MRAIVWILLVLGFAAYVHCEETTQDINSDDDDVGILECMFEDNAGNCLRTRLARDLDRIEVEVTGKKNKPPMSAVIEQAGTMIAEIVDDLQESGAKEIVEEDEVQDENIEEARGKKDKKKKKYVQRLMGMAMLMKAKISLLLQLVSTHFQMKFFIIAILSLILNATRFWLEIKKNQPAKVIYYEHAQHQHHYEHDDHDHGWGRSSNETPQEIAYRAYVPAQ